MVIYSSKWSIRHALHGDETNVPGQPSCEYKTWKLSNQGWSGTMTKQLTILWICENRFPQQRMGYTDQLHTYSQRRKKCTWRLLGNIPFVGSLSVRLAKNHLGKPPSFCQDLRLDYPQFAVQANFHPNGFHLRLDKSSSLFKPLKSCQKLEFVYVVKSDQHVLLGLKKPQTPRSYSNRSFEDKATHSLCCSPAFGRTSGQVANPRQLLISSCSGLTVGEMLSPQRIL